MNKAATRAIEKIAQREGVSVETVRKEIELAIRMSKPTNQSWVKSETPENVVTYLAGQVFLKRQINK